MFTTSLWIILYFALVLGFVFGVRILRDQRVKWRTIELDDISILVPFRNEQKHLKSLLEACIEQKEQVARWIFVNDHSDDGGDELVQSYADEYDRITLIHLPEEDEGKKMAIRFGLLEVETPYFITMDADVLFGPDYTSNLKQLPDADMIQFPVQMNAPFWWQIPFQLEYALTHLINKGIAGWKRPVNASGANLFFVKEVFDEVDDIDTHAHIASGDDMYALRAFRNAGKKVAIFENKQLTVFTDSPNRISALIDQRLRWMTKTSDVGDNLNSSLGIIALVMHLWYFLLLISTYLSDAPIVAFILVLVKGAIDFSLLRLDIKPWNFSVFLGLVLFELIYPIYLLLLIISSVFTQPEWKGRT